jgi:hypothetical protein
VIIVTEEKSFCIHHTKKQPGQKKHLLQDGFPWHASGKRRYRKKSPGKSRKVIMQAPTNGFFYVIDRVTGELLSAEKSAR